jgi:hypothetical protein
MEAEVHFSADQVIPEQRVPCTDHHSYVRSSLGLIALQEHLPPSYSFTYFDELHQHS